MGSDDGTSSNQVIPNGFERPPIRRSGFPPFIDGLHSIPDERTSISVKMPTHIVAVGGIVENEQGQILLVKTQHGGWVYPGGQVEAGENLIDALAREIQEESGIDVKVSYLIGVSSNTGIHLWYDGVTEVPTKVMLDFKCEPVGGKLRTSEETSDCRWVEKSYVLDLITAPAIRTRFQAYLHYCGRPVYNAYVTDPDFELNLTATI